MEAQPGYHATGRSAAFWAETYGGPHVQPLTTASGPLLAPWLEPLGSLHIARADEQAAVDAELAAFAASGVTLEQVDPRTRIPGLRENWSLALWEPSCAYIDVAGLHGECLKTAKRAGAELRTSAELTGAELTGAELTGAELTGAERVEGRWRLATRDGGLEADVLVDAAGAWADAVALLAGARPLGIEPFRRTMVQIATDPAPPAGLPHVGHLSGSFYFKPEGATSLWLSPHDEIPSPACDAQPEEIDIAIAIDRFENCVDWRIAKLEHKWAGLRSFAPDRLPVYGFDARVPGFFWFAGQGGFGIQTAPAAAKLGAALLLGRGPDAAVAGIDAERYAPGRFG